MAERRWCDREWRRSQTARHQPPRNELGCETFSTLPPKNSATPSRSDVDPIGDVPMMPLRLDSIINTSLYCNCHLRFRATTPLLEHRPLAPPTRAVHSRCPFALPARVARSRRPLAPQPSLTGARPSWSVLTSQYRPICTHPRSCLQRALLRGRLGHARRASTSGAQGIVQAGATSRRHSVLLIQHRFGDARDAQKPTCLRGAGRSPLP